MNSLYTIAGSSALGISPAVILPILILTAVVTSVAGLAIGIGRWKARHGYINRVEPSPNVRGDRGRPLSLCSDERLLGERE
jgi:hypothetical protein